MGGAAAEGHVVYDKCAKPYVATRSFNPILGQSDPRKWLALLAVGIRRALMHSAIDPDHG
jgi:hypothetical protein